MCSIRVNEGNECNEYYVNESYECIQHYVEDSGCDFIKATLESGHEAFFMKANVLLVVNN